MVPLKAVTGDPELEEKRGQHIANPVSMREKRRELSILGFGSDSCREVGKEMEEGYFWRNCYGEKYRQNNSKKQGDRREKTSSSCLGS